MHTHICATCCAEFPSSDTPPDICPICADPRQYVPVDGQKWTHEAELAANGHVTEWREEEPGLLGIGVTPKAGIGQRALLIEHPEGGVLWDGIPLLDDAAIAEINRRGGVRAMVMSHPHLYGAMVTNSIKLGNVPIYLPAADRDWVMYPHDNITYFDGDNLDLGQGVTVQVAGGHFAGSAFLHWADGADGKGVILTGDTIMVAADHDWVSFMWSYPNMVPLGPKAVRAIVAATERYEFDRIRGAWWDTVMQSGAKAKLAASEQRFQDAIANG